MICDFKSGDNFWSRCEMEDTGDDIHPEDGLIDDLDDQYESDIMYDPHECDDIPFDMCECGLCETHAYGEMY